MNNEALLWVAQQIDIEAMLITQIESDTPVGSYIRERVVKWLIGKKIVIMPNWADESKFMICDPYGWDTLSFGIDQYASYEQSILAACQWAYDNREVE